MVVTTRTQPRCRICPFLTWPSGARRQSGSSPPDLQPLPCRFASATIVSADPSAQHKTGEIDLAAMTGRMELLAALFEQHGLIFVGVQEGRLPPSQNINGSRYAVWPAAAVPPLNNLGVQGRQRLQARRPGRGGSQLEAH